MTTRTHLSVDRLGLIRDLRRGVWKVSDITSGYTKKQLIAKLEAMTDRLLPMGKPCEGWTPEKGCPGHEAGETEPEEASPAHFGEGAG
ncbi:MAG TPA: hypothetical protein VGK73_11235 [Polyangiaceae bacterium]